MVSETNLEMTLKKGGIEITRFIKFVILKSESSGANMQIFSIIY